MIERLLGGVIAPVTDVVSVGLLRLGGALRARWHVRRAVDEDGAGRGGTARDGAREGGAARDGTRQDGARTTEELVLEVAITTAALALAPLIAGTIVRGIARRTLGRRR